MEILGILFWIIGLLCIEDESFNIPLEVLWNIHCKELNKKGMDLLTSARCEFELWRMAKKIKVIVEERATTISIEEDGFRNPSGERSNTIDDGLDGFGSDVDDNEQQKL